MVKADINFRRVDYQRKHKLCDDCQIFLVPVDDRNAGTKFQVSEVKHRETTIFSVMKECNIKVSPYGFKSARTDDASFSNVRALADASSCKAANKSTI